MPCAKESEDGSRKRYMKDMVLRNGLDEFDDSEVLEFYLYYAVSDCSIAPLARRLIERYLTFGGVCDAPIDELTDDFGLSENAALLLKLLPQMSRLYVEAKTENDTIVDCNEIGKRFQAKFIGRTNEALALMLINGNGEVVYFKIIAEGSLNSTDVPLRKIMDLALKHYAKYVFIGHNHPSGSALPSENDLKTTKVIRYTLDKVGVKLVDHFIVTDDDFVSICQSEFTGKIIFTDREEQEI